MDERRLWLVPYVEPYIFEDERHDEEAIEQLRDELYATSSHPSTTESGSEDSSGKEEAGGLQDPGGRKRRRLRSEEERFESLSCPSGPDDTSRLIT